MGKRLTIAWVVLSLLATTARADAWLDLDGQSAPEVSAPEWLHVPDGPFTPDRLKGKVWLLAFLAVH